MKYILSILILSSATLFSLDKAIEKGVQFCQEGKIDSALHYLNIVGDEVTIETSLEDIFQKNYHTARCYDKLEANKSAEFYYLKALRIMDSSDISNPKLYLRLANFYERIYNFKGSNEYLRRYYDSELENLNEEINVANEQVGRLDSLESQAENYNKVNTKLQSDIRLLIVLIAVFGIALAISIIVIIRKKNLNRKS